MALSHTQARTTRRLATIADAAEYACVSTKTIRRRVSAGDLTAYRLGPRLLRIDLNELDDNLRPVPTAGGASC